MDPALTALLAALHRHGVEHDAGKTNRTERLRNLEPDTAAVLSLLVRATGARRVLELGTSNGYSTVWLADAVRATGGHLLSVDVDAERIAEAKGHLARAGLSTKADLRIQDAAAVLQEAPDSAWDIIFLDAERPAYTEYWPDLMRAIRPGGLIAVDNAVSHAGELTAFRTLVSTDTESSEALIPCGAGLLLIVRDPKQAVDE